MPRSRRSVRRRALGRPRRLPEHGRRARPLRRLRPSRDGRAEIRCGGLAQRQARGRVSSRFARRHGYSYFDDVARGRYSYF